METWWLPWAWPTSTATVQRVDWKPCTPTVAASIDVRTTVPRPVRPRSTRAASTPYAPYMPASRSAIGGANLLRVAGAGSGERHQARFALGDLVVARAAAFGAVVPEARDRMTSLGFSRC